jgi:histone PARylation factor 1
MTRPRCRYWDQCFRKNPDHRQQFLHPQDLDSTIPTDDSVADSATVAIADTSTDTHTAATAAVQSASPSPSPKRKASSAAALLSSDSESDSKVASSGVQKRVRLTVNHTADSKNAVKRSALPSSATVSEICDQLQEMYRVPFPEEFAHVYRIAASLNPSRPHDAFKSAHIRLIGPFHALAGKFHPDDISDSSVIGKATTDSACRAHLYCRHVFDSPELLTVAVFSQSNNGDNDQKMPCRWSYYRDDPSTQPLFVVHGTDESGKVEFAGDSLLTVIVNHVHEYDSKLSNQLAKLLENQAIAIDTDTKTISARSSGAWKQRQKDKVASCGNGVGICVPVEDDVGYRPLPLTTTQLKNIIAHIDSKGAGHPSVAKDREELFRMFNLIQYANDECDFGMGLELGLRLFVHSKKLTKTSVRLLASAYTLLKRDFFAQLVRIMGDCREVGTDMLDASFI